MESQNPTPDMFDRASEYLAAHPDELEEILAGSTLEEADAALDVPPAPPAQ